jgi:hypothetical protein
LNFDTSISSITILSGLGTFNLDALLLQISAFIPLSDPSLHSFIIVHEAFTMASQPAQKSTTSPWIVLAVASGAFAALNGVFAKL